MGVTEPGGLDCFQQDFVINDSQFGIGMERDLSRVVEEFDAL
jgi:hypothetical protein